MSGEQKHTSNITTQFESEIISRVISAIQRDYAAACNAIISQITADYRDFVNTYPAASYVTDTHVENDGPVTTRRYHDVALSMVAAFYGIEGISCTVWKSQRPRDGVHTMYLYKFGPKIRRADAGALPSQFPIVG